MSAPDSPRGRTAQLSIYRLLLRLLPASVRREHGAEMVALMDDHLARASSIGGRVSVWMGALIDLAQHGRPLRRTERNTSPALRASHGLAVHTDGVHGGVSGAIHGALRDARHGVRLLRRDLGFTTAAVLTLGLAIGANTAIFSFVDVYLLRPLPYPAPEDLGMVTTIAARTGDSDDVGQLVGTSQDGHTWGGRA